VNKFWEKYKKYKDILYMVAIVIFMLLFAKGCMQNKADTKRISELLEYKHTVEQYKTKNGILVNYNKSLEVTERDLNFVKDTLLNYIKEIELKKPKVITIIDTRLELDSIPYPIYLTDCDFDTTINIDSTHYNINMTLRNTGVIFNNLSFPNRIGVTVGEHREKWWKKKETIVAVTNSNPLITVEGITSYTFKPKKKFFDRTWVKITGGAILGVAGTYLLMK
jgi:hypothetical protein